jgi:hypothetical protein
MAVESHVIDITRVIQLSVAPVFLLTAVGTIITALNNRLGRVVDRRRILEEQRLPDLDEVAAAPLRAELRILARRIRLVYFAITFAVVCALLVCLLIVGAFLAAFMSADLSELVAGLFVLAMLALIACLTIFLREVYVAVTGGAHTAR